MTATIDYDVAGLATPTMAEMLTEAIRGAMFDLHTGLPAAVVNYDPSAQSCTVRPLLRRAWRMDDGSVRLFDIPLITHVPVVFPAGGGWSLTWPLVAGDVVYLAFAERSLDSWLASPPGPTVDPLDVRMHDLSDAVAIPGLRQRQAALLNAGLSGIRLGREDGTVEVSMTAGEIHIKAPLVVLDSGGSADSPIPRGEPLRIWLETLSVWLQALVLPVSGGSAGPPLAPPPPLPADLLSLTAKVK